jgi:hypothetical protein
MQAGSKIQLFKAMWAPADRDGSRTLIAITAEASTGAGAIHAAVAARYVAIYPLYAVLFAALAAAQVIWALIALLRPARAWFALAAGGNLAAALVWIWSRTAGIPFGPFQGSALPIGFPDVLTTAFEVLVIAGCVAVFRSIRVPHSGRLWAHPAWTPFVGLVVLGLTVVGTLEVLCILPFVFTG